MSDIDLTISAKNEASRILRELSADVQQSAKSIEFSFGGFSQLVAGSLVASAIENMISGFSKLSSASLDAFDKATKASRGLKDALASFGGNEGAADGLEKVADRLERLTNIDSNRLLGTMSQLARKGNDPEEIDDMTKAAIGLANVFGTDLADGARRAQEAIEGNFGAFKSLEEVQAAAEAGFRRTVERSNDSVSASDRLDLSITNLYESFGKLIDPVRSFSADALNAMSWSIENVVLPSIDSLNLGMEKIRDVSKQVFDAMASSVVTSFSVMSTAINRFQDTIDLMSLSIQLSIEKMRASIEHTFTVQIPSYFSFMGQLFDKDGNARWDWIGKLALAGDFSSAFSEFADSAPAREKTGQERMLESSMEVIAQRLAQDFGQRLEVNMNLWGQMMQSIFGRNEVGADGKINLNARQGDRGLGDQDRILSSFQSDTLRYSPQSMALEKQVEILLEMNAKQNELVELTREQARNRKPLISLVPAGGDL